MMKELAYYDGNIGSPDELTVPFNDRVHFFGDGVYEATVSGNHKPFLLDEHLDRFFSSARAVGINMPMEKSEMHDLICELDKKVEGNTHFVYWQVTRGISPRLHDFKEELTGKLWVMIRPNKLNDPESPVKLIVREDNRFLLGNIKSLNLLPAVLFSQEAKQHGAFETVLHRGGMVTECAHSNVCILKNGVLLSHPNDNLILRGISKTHMFEACYRLGITVLERAFSLEELYDADEIIVTSASNFCLHANQIEDRPAGGRDKATLSEIQNAVMGEYLEFTGRTSIFD